MVFIDDNDVSEPEVEFEIVGDSVPLIQWVTFKGREVFFHISAVKFPCTLVIVYQAVGVQLYGTLTTGVVPVAKILNIANGFLTG